jgi:hypothetical protein
MQIMAKLTAVTDVRAQMDSKLFQLGSHTQVG